MIVSNSALDVGNEIFKELSKLKNIPQKSNQYNRNINDDNEMKNWKTSMALELEQYYDFLKNVKKCSNNTMESYQRDLRQFHNHVLENNISYLDYDANNILDYLKGLEKIGKSDATRARILASVKGFYIFLMSKHKIKNDSIAAMQTVKVEKKKVVEDDVKEKEYMKKYILNIKVEDSPKGIRDKAILEMTYNTNIKATQLISLKMDDYDKENKTMKVESKKIALSNSVCDAISKYLEYSRETLIMYKNVPELFVNAQGNKMTRQGYWKIVKSYEERYNIDNSVSKPNIFVVENTRNNDENIFREKFIVDNKIEKENDKIEFWEKINSNNYENEQSVVSKIGQTIDDEIGKNNDISVTLETSNDIVSNFILKCMNNDKKEE